MSDEPGSSPAETYERHLGAAIADPFARVLIGLAGPQPADRALDLACGTGSVARRAAPLVGAGGRVLAIDINPDMLARAARSPRRPVAVLAAGVRRFRRTSRRARPLPPTTVPARGWDFG